MIDADSITGFECTQQFLRNDAISALINLLQENYEYLEELFGKSFHCTIQLLVFASIAGRPRSASCHCRTASDALLPVSSYRVPQRIVLNMKLSGKGSGYYASIGFITAIGFLTSMRFYLFHCSFAKTLLFAPLHLPGKRINDFLL